MIDSMVKIDERVAQALANTHTQLELELPFLLSRVHDEAYSAIRYRGDETGAIAQSKKGSRPPGRGDSQAVAAYRSASQDIARAFYENAKISYHHGVPLMGWSAVPSLLPIITCVPSPSELIRGIRKLKMSLFSLIPVAADELAVIAGKSLVDGPAFHIDRARNNLMRATEKPRGATSGRTDIQAAVERQRQRWLR